ncbi:hypothetical protein DPMN_143133 [Dreissena polymorpha]|uniref:Uncharacterized protein n=1 Tax=Dreissena polymorpha TaxID=45954 RepID=A0A9D4GD26_DREPO|nr:hypothetical protein DPMN_143133 [Dreissena polymorpha]
MKYLHPLSNAWRERSADTCADGWEYHQALPASDCIAIETAKTPAIITSGGVQSCKDTTGSE